MKVPLKKMTNFQPMFLFNDNPLETQLTPEGLIIIPNFISDEAALNLLDKIDQSPWITDLKRRVQHYGYKYDYSNRAAGPSSYLGPLPDWAENLANTLYDRHFFKRPPDQVIVNEYLPGQGISAHIDAVQSFGDIIASLSLNSTCMMDFVKNGDQSKQKYHQILYPNSLAILSGPARYDWTHEIPARQSDMINGIKHPRGRRVSLTFRTMRTV